MAQNPFERLAPFIQEFIYREKWTELRDIQVKTARAVFDTPDHILIASATASGKTEAAFLPALTEIYNAPPASIGILYIGPLKALINDQFERLEYLLEEAGIPVQSWHGDVSQSKKRRFLKKARGVLQITPESLESMLMHRGTQLRELFGDLRFVIIDEVHAFIDSDRGRQVICQLGRLARHQTNPPRRIGLSATIGEPEKALDWLAGGTDQSVTLVEGKSRPEVMLGLEYFPDLPYDFEKRLKQAAAAQDEGLIAMLEALGEENHAMYEHLYNLTLNRKSLVFANSRGNVEDVISSLRSVARREGSPDIYHVHHGSISAPLREAAESAMKDPDRPACTAATITLELGIDVGQLEQVLQMNATHSVSSFVQRLGRSGRRGEPARMFFYSSEQIEDDKASLGRRIPWNLLQTIAIIQLYVEEKWIEPPEIPCLPLSLLYHQTMSCIYANTELKPPQLAERVLTLPPFANVTQEQYRDLLRHLLEIEHLELTEIGGLIVGLEGEKVANNYRFYATFEDEVVYQVRTASREIGTIQTSPTVGDRIGLAGRAWEVVDVDNEKRTIYVEGVSGKAPALWTGGGVRIHGRIVERVRQVLKEDAVYAYLGGRAAKRLAEARDLARRTHLAESAILPLGGDRWMILPWCGTRVVETMELILEHAGMDTKNACPPFYFEVDWTGTASGLAARFGQIAADAPAAEELVSGMLRAELERNKYDRFVPEHLLRQAMVADDLNMDGAIDALSRSSISSMTSNGVNGE